MAPFRGDVLDVHAARLGDPQAEQPEEAGKGVVGRSGGGALGDEGAQFHTVEPEGGRLGVDPGPPHVLSR